MAPKKLQTQTSSNSIGDETRVYTKKEQEALEVALDDVQTRFLYNLPTEELATSDRIFFQIEQAWWFYEDILRDGLGGSNDDIEVESNKNLLLPRFKHLSAFAKEMFRFSPMLQPLLPHFDSMWSEFSAYRGKISTFGCILLNRECTKVVLIKGWKSNNWTFPSGKVNQNESGIDAGARETYEESGFDPSCSFGICKEMAEAGLSLTWEPLKEENAVMYFEDGKQRTCYICKGVPESFPFAPVTRKEVSEVRWHDIEQIPKRTYAVIPFLSQLKRWIKRDKKKHGTEDDDDDAEVDRQRYERSNSAGSEGAVQNRDGSRKRNDRPSSRHSSRGKGRLDKSISSLIDSGLASDISEKGWNVDEMFKVNEAITGRKVLYDGDPQIFASKGFDGVDPHSFRVVGGHFMNTNTTTIAPVPDRRALQPLFHPIGDNGKVDDSFQPFFTDEGHDGHRSGDNEALKAESNHHEYIAASMGHTLIGPDGEASTLIALNPLEVNVLTNNEEKQMEISPFLTDAEITKRHQMLLNIPIHVTESTNAAMLGHIGPDSPAAEYIVDARAFGIHDTKTVFVENNSLLFLRNWVRGLPTHPPTLQFGDFRFDVEAIMNAMKERI
jgi:mRNA-decapping enzyme subunit 2